MGWIDRAGAVVVAVLVLAIGAVAFDVIGAPTTPGFATTGDSAVSTLVEAWARSRTATYRATGTVARTAPDGRRLAAEVEVVQRPPDRLVRQFGDVSGRRGNRALRCLAPTPADGPACTLDPPGMTFDDVVAAEVDEFATLVEGAEPLYEVRRRSPVCWRITRTRYDPRSGLGIQAEVCVDSATGAVRSLDIDHGTLTERTDYDQISPTVTDADLEP